MTDWRQASCAWQEALLAALARLPPSVFQLAGHAAPCSHHRRAHGAFLDGMRARRSCLLQKRSQGRPCGDYGRSTRGQVRLAFISPHGLSLLRSGHYASLLPALVGLTNTRLTHAGPAVSSSTAGLRRPGRRCP